MLATSTVIQNVLFGSIFKLEEMSKIEFKLELALNLELLVLEENQRAIMEKIDHPITIWEMFASQLVWLIGLICSGLFSEYAKFILWVVWIGLSIWLFLRIVFKWELQTFNRVTPPPTPK